MTNSIHWIKGCTPSERISLLHSQVFSATNIVYKNSPENKKWEKHFETIGDAPLRLKLQYKNVSLKQFYGAINNEISGIDASSPYWVTIFEEAYFQTSCDYTTLQKKISPESPITGFLYLAEPLYNYYTKRFREKLDKELSLTKELDAVIQILEGQIHAAFFQLLHRTLVLELNTSRLLDELKGDTAEERFHYFTQLLQDPIKIRSLWEEYPVLFRKLIDVGERWLLNSSELAVRLLQDFSLLEKEFGKLGALRHIHAGAGDTHNGGKSVAVIEFEEGKKVLYKPRSMAIDVHFSELVDWINDKPGLPGFVFPKVLNRIDYGWMEYIEHKTCTTGEEFTLFYERFGGLLCLLYALNSVDFHFENIIAHGTHPVLIDLETLFHPNIDFVSNELNDMLMRTMGASVLSVGILPMQWYINDVKIDISGVNNPTGKESPYKVLDWDKTATDEMRLVQKTGFLKGSKNYPAPSDQQVNLEDYLPAIEKGFREVYRTITNHKSELLKPNGKLYAFANDEIRVILRPTMAYSQLLRASYHPDYMRDASDAEILFDVLWESVTERPALEPIIEDEIRALHSMDIPLFSVAADSHHLKKSDGGLVTDFISKPGLQLALEKIADFNEENCEKQCWFIRASLSAAQAAEKTATNVVAYFVKEDTVLANRDTLIREAEKIADHLIDGAYKHKDTAGWIGLSLKMDHYTIIPLALDLYSGLPGVALFLAYLAEVTGKEKYHWYANASANYILEEVERYRLTEPSKNFIGVFDGWAGCIYTFAHIGRVLQRKELYDTADSIIDHLAEAVSKDDRYDIMGGSAGFIMNLLALNTIHSSNKYIDMAMHCFERLKENAVILKTGKGWSNLTESEPLCGFSHGVAGIAYALSALYQKTKNKAMLKLSQEALLYERHCYIPKKRNWADLRKVNVEAGNTKFIMKNYSAWCHGAAGVGLGRLGMVKHGYTEPEINKEIENALATTFSYGFGMGHSLCHGDLGNIELLLLYDQVYKTNRYQKDIQQIAGAVLKSFGTYGWLCGVPMKVETPGFMTGIAGMGYQLLRIAEPTKVPSALILEAPLLEN